MNALQPPALPGVTICPPAAPTIHRWLDHPPGSEVEDSLARMARVPGVQRIAVMPDVHLAGEACVGTVVATADTLLPNAVGGDIGCGMLSQKFDLLADHLRDGAIAGQLLRALYKRVPASRHHLPRRLPDSIDPAQLSNPTLASEARRDGSVQLGTLGRGNHFVELQRDDADKLWVTIHTGSRAMGQAVRNFYVPQAPRVEGVCVLAASEETGARYVQDAQWARRYALENRLAILAAVAQILREMFDANPVAGARIHADHNHLQQEEHLGRLLWVHRKGATSARAGELGVVPGSMGTATYHIEGRGCADALMSCAHGAGRKFSRAQAKMKISRGMLLSQMQGVWFDTRHAGDLRDEAPSAYKDIHRVMRAQGELVKVIRVLRPVLVYKGA
jgi:tRNA-splicing ligase RtcB